MCVRPAAPQVGSFTVVFRLLFCDTLISISISNMLSFFRPVAAGPDFFPLVDFPFFDSLIIPHFVSFFHFCDLHQPQVEILNFFFFDFSSVTFSFSYFSYDFFGETTGKVSCTCRRSAKRPTCDAAGRGKKNEILQVWS